MAEKRPISLRNFTAFSSSAAVFQVTEDAAPELYALAQQFPAAVSRALKSLGWYVQKSMKETIAAGGTTQGRWQELSEMRRYRRMDRLKANEFPRRSYAGTTKSEMIKKWTGGSDNTIFGRVARTIAYRKPKDRQMVEIGALSPSAAKFLSAVQEGRRGGKGSFRFAGVQAVTPAMRRAFWAAGVPLASETTTIGQPARSLVPPVFQQVQPELEVYLVRKITDTLAKQGITWTTA